jgi:hypothetical protein
MHGATIKETEGVCRSLFSELSGDVIKFPLCKASSSDVQTNLDQWVF